MLEKPLFRLFALNVRPYSSQNVTVVLGINNFPSGDKFTVRNTTNVKANNQHAQPYFPPALAITL